MNIRLFVSAACWLVLVPCAVAVFARGASAAPPAGSPMAEWTRWDAKALALLQRTRDTVEAAPALYAHTVASARFTGRDAGETRERLKVAKLSENEEPSDEIRSYIGAAMSDGRGGTLYCCRRIDDLTVAPSWNRVRIRDTETPAQVDLSWPPSDALVALVPLRGQTPRFAVLDSELAKPADLFMPSLNPIARVRDAERDGTLVDVVYTGRQEWGGGEYDVVIYHSHRSCNGASMRGAIDETVRLFLGSDGLLHRAAMEAECCGTRIMLERVYRYDTLAGDHR